MRNVYLHVFSSLRNWLLLLLPSLLYNIINNNMNIMKIIIIKLSEINEEMKMAAAIALAELTEQPVPEEVKSAFPADKDFTFGPNYIVPTPFDPRLLKCVAVATAKAACESGVARRPIEDWAAYEASLDKLQA